MLKNKTILAFQLDAAKQAYQYTASYKSNNY